MNHHGMGGPPTGGKRWIRQDALEELLTAGDEMASKLRSAPGIDMMRGSYLDRWGDAKRSVVRSARAR